MLRAPFHQCTRDRFILQNCQIWVVDMEEADLVEQLAVSAAEEKEDAPSFAPVFSVFGGPLGGSARASSWLSHGSTEAPPPPSHDPLPPPPPAARKLATTFSLLEGQRAVPFAAGAASSASPGSSWLGRGWHSGIGG